jgi:hypothetical protein
MFNAVLGIDKENVEDRPDHNEDILTFQHFLYMGLLFYGEFADFIILYLQFLYLYSTDNMY